MSGFLNPDLGDPSKPVTEFSVPPLARITQAEPAVIMPTKKAYLCSVPNAAMFTHGAVKIVFIGGYLETDLQAVQLYLDEEIRIGNIYIKAATAEEQRAAHMRVNPEGTLEREISARLEVTLREKILAELAASNNSNSTVIQDRDRELIAGVDTDVNVAARTHISGTAIVSAPGQASNAQLALQAKMRERIAAEGLAREQAALRKEE